MRVVVTGATGNTGTSLVRLLSDDPKVTAVVGVARRRPTWQPHKVTWLQADVSRDDLRPIVAGADAVVHLAWLLQPSRDEREQWRTNVIGTGRVLGAVADAKVPAFVYASSIGAYSPAPPETHVDESWPTDGVPTSAYSRQKAYTERQLDAFCSRHPGVRVVRLRPGLIVKSAAATHIRRLFTGPLMPKAVVRAVGLPMWPRGVRLQFVHTDDVARAYQLALHSDTDGAFNVAADPVIDAEAAAAALAARPLTVPRWALWWAVNITWRLRLQPTDPGWVDMAVDLPVMATDRAREHLGWTPAHRADEALASLVAGFGRGDDFPTPPLDEATSGPVRANEIATGIGRRST